MIFNIVQTKLYYNREKYMLRIECSMTEEAGWRFGEHIHLMVWDQ